MSINSRRRARIYLEMIKLDIEDDQMEVLRDLVDPWYCYKHGYTNRNGKRDWSLINGNEWVSPGYTKLVNDGEELTSKNHVQKEHIIPLQVIKQHLRECDHSTTAIEAVLDDKLMYATISKEEDKLLRMAGLNHKMPDEYYNPSHELYNDPLARYKKVGITLTKV